MASMDDGRTGKFGTSAASTAAHETRIAQELISVELGGKRVEPFVYNLVGQEGNYQTEPIGNNRRSFGIWSYRQPREGDLVVRPIPGKTDKSLWRIESAASDFRGSDGNQFWTGVMVDVIATEGSVTREIYDLLKSSGLA